jgi:hypothetical protein
MLRQFASSGHRIPNKILTDEINTTEDMRLECSEQVKQLYMTNKKNKYLYMKSPLTLSLLQTNTNK